MREDLTSGIGVVVERVKHLMLLRWFHLGEMERKQQRMIVRYLVGVPGWVLML